MVEVSVSNDFDFASEEYAALFERSSATGFQHPIWLTSFYANLVAPAAATPHLFEFREADGTLTGLVPLILRRKSGLRLLESTDLGVADYSSPVLSETLIRAMQSDNAIAKRFRRMLPSHDVFRIRPVREEHSAQWRLLAGSEGRPLGFSSYAAPLGGNFDNWQSTKLDSSLGKQLLRKERKVIREYAAQLVLLKEETEIRDAITSLAALRKGRFEQDVIQNMAALGHYLQVATSGAASGYAATYVLNTNDGPIGYVFGVCHRGSLYYLLIGCDYDRWGKFSPGLLFYKMIIREWMDRGGDVFDFTIGGEDFKMKFGTVPTRMHAHLSAGSLVGRIACLALPSRVMGEGA